MFSSGWSFFWAVPRLMEVANEYGEVADARGEVAVGVEGVLEPVGVDGSSEGVTDVELSAVVGGLASKDGASRPARGRSSTIFILREQSHTTCM